MSSDQVQTKAEAEIIGEIQRGRAEVVRVAKRTFKGRVDRRLCVVEAHRERRAIPGDEGGADTQGGELEGAVAGDRARHRRR